MSKKSARLLLSAWACSSLVSELQVQAVQQPDYRYMAFLFHDWDNGEIDYMPPQELFAYASKKQSDPDQPPFHLAMKGEQVQEWSEACQAEVSELTARKTSTEVDKRTLPADINILPATWALKVK